MRTVDMHSSLGSLTIAHPDHFIMHGAKEIGAIDDIGDYGDGVAAPRKEGRSIMQDARLALGLFVNTYLRPHHREVYGRYDLMPETDKTAPP